MFVFLVRRLLPFTSVCIVAMLAWPGCARSPTADSQTNGSFQIQVGQAKTIIEPHRDEIIRIQRELVHNGQSLRELENISGRRNASALEYQRLHENQTLLHNKLSETKQRIVRQCQRTGIPTNAMEQAWDELIKSATTPSLNSEEHD